MPSQLEAGILYYSKDFETAAHLCACGCGEKIRTPIAATEWSLGDDEFGPTLWPSIGNWQKPCRAHYFITDGSVIWAPRWSQSKIDDGRLFEQKRRTAYYSDQERKRFRNPIRWLLARITALFNRLG